MEVVLRHEIKKKRILLLFSILLILPLISAVDMSNVTIRATEANYTIYINGSISFDRLYVIGTEIMIYNLSTRGLFNNNNATYPSTVAFYGLNNSPGNDDLTWDNGTVVMDLTDVNITVPAGRYYVIGGDIDGPVITIELPDGSDVISITMLIRIITDEVSSCNYSINDGINISMSTSDNLTFSDVIAAPGPGDNIIYFYCFDASLANNLNVSNQTFLAREWIGGGGGGEGPGGFVIVDTNATLIDVNIILDPMWFFSKKHFVTVVPVDKYNKVVIITNITIRIVENISFEESIVKLLTDKSYEKNFIIEEQNITNLTIYVEAIQNNKIITKIKSVSIDKMSLPKKIEKEITKWYKFLSGFFNIEKLKENMSIIISAFLSTIVLIIVILSLKRRKKESKKI